MNLRRLTVGLLAAIAAAAMLAGPADAGARTKRSAQPFGTARPMRPSTTDIGRKIDVNNINMFVTNTGSFGFDLAASDAGMWYPKGTDKSAIFASGLWLGCTVGAETRTVVAEYSQEYGPGRMDAGTFTDPTLPAYKVYKVVRW